MSGLSSSHILLLLPLLQAASAIPLACVPGGPPSYLPGIPADITGTFSALHDAALESGNDVSYSSPNSYYRSFTSAPEFANYDTVTSCNDAGFIVYEDSTGEEPKGYASRRQQQSRTSRLPCGCVDSHLRGEIAVHPDPNCNTVHKASYDTGDITYAAPPSPVHDSYAAPSSSSAHNLTATPLTRRDAEPSKEVLQEWNLFRRGLTAAQQAEMDEEEAMEAGQNHIDESLQRRNLDPALAAELDEEEAMEAGQTHLDNTLQRRNIDPAIAAELDEEEAMEAGQNHVDHTLERRHPRRWGPPPPPPPPSPVDPEPEKPLPTPPASRSKVKRNMPGSGRDMNLQDLPPININVFQLPTGDYVQEPFGTAIKAPSNARTPPKPAHESVRGFQREFGWLYPDAHQGTYKLSMSGFPNIGTAEGEEVGPGYGKKKVVEFEGLGDTRGDAIEVFEQWQLKSDVASNRGLVWIREKEPRENEEQQY